MFNLENEIKKWKKALRKTKSIDDGNIVELEEHLRDLFESEKENSRSDAEAFNLAVKQIGEIKYISEEFKIANPSRFNDYADRNNQWFYPALMLNYFKIAVRNISKQKGFSFINLFGLSVGLTIFILIMLFVRYEYSYDKYNENADHIYRVATEFHGHSHDGNQRMAQTRGFVGPALTAEFPEVLASARLRNAGNVKFIIDDKKFIEEDVYFADKEIFKIFTLPVVNGNSENPLDDHSSVVLSEDAAIKFFGSQNPIGKTLSFSGEHDFTVSAVMQNMPDNSHFNIEILFSIEARNSMTNTDFTTSPNSSAYTYFLLSENASTVDLQSKLPALVEKYTEDTHRSGHRHSSTLFLQKLTDIHLRSNFASEIKSNGSITSVYLYSSVGILILLIASLNYMNLSAVRSLQRTKEVGIRKTVGAGKFSLIKQFLSESVILSFSALGFSIISIIVILPFFNELMERKIALFDSSLPLILLATVILTLCVGIISGAYPAFFVSSFKPVNILNGNIQLGKGRAILRNVFVVFQFAVTIILIIATIVIKNQLSFIHETDVGYNKDQILTIHIESEDVRNNIKIVKDELSKNPSIINVSSSTYLPNWIRDQMMLKWPGQDDDIEIIAYTSNIDYHYLDLYDIEIVDGRNFSEDFPSDANGAFLINETALDALGWENPLDRELKHWSGPVGKVVGVIKDFNFQSLHLEIEPLVLFLQPNKRHFQLSVQIAGHDLKSTISFIENTIETFSADFPFTYSFFDEEFDKAYNDEKKLEQLFSLVAIIAIVLSCLGLFGLAAFTAEKRTKEIGIRKVLGASVFTIIKMLTREFSKSVLIANIAAWPIAYYFMNDWLETFAFKIELGIGLFILAALIVYIIAIITVALQTLKSATANPVEVLKYE